MPKVIRPELRRRQASRIHRQDARRFVTVGFFEPVKKQVGTRRTIDRSGDQVMRAIGARSVDPTIWFFVNANPDPKRMN